MGSRPRLVAGSFPKLPNDCRLAARRCEGILHNLALCELLCIGHYTNVAWKSCSHISKDRVQLQVLHSSRQQIRRAHFPAPRAGFSISAQLSCPFRIDFLRGISDSPDPSLLLGTPMRQRSRVDKVKLPLGPWEYRIDVAIAGWRQRRVELDACVFAFRRCIRCIHSVADRCGCCRSSRRRC